MKKIIIIFISLIIVLFSLVCYMVNNNNKYVSKMEELIIKNTDIQNIDYINKYEDNYIVMDKEYVYLINRDFKIVFKIELTKIHENKNNYDIIYRQEELVYFNSKYTDDKIIYEYYDLYTYEKVDTVVVGDG